MKTSSSEFSIPATVQLFQPIWDNFPRRFPATSQWLKEITVNKGTFFKVNEGATNCTFSQRAGKRRREVDFAVCGPPEGRGWAATPSLFPRQGLWPGFSRSRRSGNRAPRFSMLEAKRFGPTSCGSPPPGENATGLGSGAKGQEPSDPLRSQGDYANSSMPPRLLCATTSFPRSSPCLTWPEPTLSAFAWGNTAMWKTRLGRGESTLLQCWASGVLPVATPSLGPGLGPARQRGACTPNGRARALLKGHLPS